MERKICVICNETEFKPIFNLLNTIDIVSNSEYNPDEIKELNFVGCLNCGCVQLQNLFLQSDIYAEPLRIFDGPAIQKHNDLLCDFIIENVNYEKDLFEIGGGFGVLAKKIINKYHDKEITYKILEFNSDNYPKLNKIEYLSGNCELYNYEGVNTIIMSHVFEHLYNPREFLKNIKEKTNITNIFIEIPDMDNLSKNGDINNLNILHTFYINTQYINYLFHIHGFINIATYNYDNNSNFYYFKRYIQEDIIIPEYRNLELLNQQFLFYETTKTNIRNININSPFFICPSGFYGQYIYFNLNNDTKSNAIGFLDGNVYKINKRLSGTNLYIYDKTEIQTYNKIVVLITSKKHENEIKVELEKYNKEVFFVYL